MKLRQLGFFRELDHGDPAGPSLMSSLNNGPQVDEDRIVSYLRDGLMFIACPGLVKDVLSESPSDIGSPSILTDGVWAWPNDLAYYVEKYHVSLPETFIKHVRDRQFATLHENDVELTELDL